MDSCLYDLLVLKDENSQEAIKRLMVFRGLSFDVHETDINTFLDDYFSKDSVSNEERFRFSRSEHWAKCFAAKPIYGIKVDPFKLEPFVARYVNAVNGIGAKTNSSCDGWHKHSNNTLFVEFKDRYSRIWHKVMCSLLNDSNGIEWLYEGNTAILVLPKTDKMKIQKYIALNKNAEAFEQRSNEMLQLKRVLMLKLKGKTKNNVPDEQIEKWFVDIIKK